MNIKIKSLVNNKELSQQDKLLLTLSISNKPMTVAQIREKAEEVGLRLARKWNISGILGKSNSKAIRIKEGWELSQSGHERINVLLSQPSPIIKSVREHLIKIKATDAKQFIEEAICCFEMKLYRAAVVFSWVGAVALLHEHVMNNKLTEFNTEAKRRDNKWKTAKKTDDLSLMKEHDFLDTLQAISILGKNIKQELQTCLQLRNSCGHPNSLKIAENKVAAHLEILLLNVYIPFT